MLLIKNGKILTMSGKTYENGDLLIENGKIAAVDKKISADGSRIKILDVKGAWVMPGLIEAHCHIGITEAKKGKEGDDCNEITNPVTPYLRSLDAINPMDAAFDDAVRAGITSVMAGPGSSNVVGGQFTFLKTKGRCVDQLVLKEPAAMKVAFGENPKVEYGMAGNMPATRMAIAAMLREELYNARAYMEKRNSLKEFDRDYKKECWAPVFQKEIPLKAHVHRVDDILTAIRIAKEYHLDLTLDHCSEGHLIVDVIKNSGFPAIVGPDLAARNKIEVQNAAFKTAGILSSAGILTAVTTDHPVSMIQTLPYCAGLAVKSGMKMEDGLKAITINAAKICRVDQWVGSLEVGKDADIAVFDGNPMEIFTSALYTIINGEIVFQKDDDKCHGKIQQISLGNFV